MGRVNDQPAHAVYFDICTPPCGLHHTYIVYILSPNRIERLWRDVFICVTELFHSLFWHLECEGLLCPDDETHMFALQWVFLPRIQMHLDFFVQGWNHHGIRTARNQSPIQLWHRFQNSPASPNLQQVSIPLKPYQNRQVLLSLEFSGNRRSLV